MFRGILHLDGGSPTAFRVVGALVAATVVLLTVWAASRLVGRIPAILAGLLLSTVAVAPRLESFTVAGEMLAAVPAVLSLIAFTFYLSDGRRRWLVAAGLLTGCAVMIKQSGFDGGLAAFAWLLIARRKQGIAPAAVLVGCAFVPVIAGIGLSGNAGDWWYAMVTYRSQGDSILSGSPADRLAQFWDGAPAVAVSLAPLVALAAIGWRRSPLLTRLWVGAAALAVIGGGNFHRHYYLQLLAPLAVIAGAGAAALVTRPRSVAIGLVSALTAATITATVPLYLHTGDQRTRSLFPEDPHLTHSAEVAAWIRGHTPPNDRLLVIWAAADLQYQADRAPATPYLWYRNLQTIPGAIGLVQGQLADPNGVRWVVAMDRPRKMDPGGTTGRLLFENFRRVATVDGIPIFERR